MVGNGNHPLNQPHYDDSILEEYVLGHLLPEEEAHIREHLAACAVCRARVAKYRELCQDISAELHHLLDRSTPGPNLSFDKIAPEWHKPPRRVTLSFKLRRLVPSASTVLLVTLLVAAFLILLPSGNTAALRNLELADDYYGPPAVFAASTQNGLVIVRVDNPGADVVVHLPFITRPRNLQLSPDGEWLAFLQDRTLHVIQTRTSGIQARIGLTETADWAWSPDSRTLAYTDGAGQLVLFDVQTQTNSVIVPAYEYAWGPPVWNTSGTQIAYTVAEPLPVKGESYVRQGIWRVNPATGYRVEVARSPHVADDSLLVPAAWAVQDSVLLAWDTHTGEQDTAPTLYRVDVNAHTIEPIVGQSLAQGNRLAWPVSSESATFVVYLNRLTALYLDSGTRQFIPDPIPWPTTLDWAPNGAWIAYTVSGMPEGKGLYLYAPEEGKLRAIALPGGAMEKATFWAGPEHLFVIRQPEGRSFTELWMVPLTSDEPPQRTMTGMRLPEIGPYAGWRWQDVLAVQVVDSHN
jgi:hypothetical protein